MIQARSIALNSIISVGARLFGTALALILTGFITRYLGQEGYGYYSTVLALLYIFTVLSDFGLYSITLRDISQESAKEDKIVSNAFTLRFFIGMAIFLGGSLAVFLFPYPSFVKIGILIGSAGFWLLSNIQVLMGVFQKHLKMGKAAFGEIMGRLVQLILIVLLIKWNCGFLSIIWAMVISSLVNFILVVFFARKYVKFGFDFDFKYWGKLLKEALPLGMAVIFVTVYFKMNIIVLSLIKSAEEVGIFGLAYKILENLIFFPHMFVGLVMPLLSAYIFVDFGLFKKVYQKSFDILSIFLLPIIVGSFILSERIVVLIGGSDFAASSGVLDILIIASGFIFLGALFSNVIIACQKQKYLSWIYGGGALFNLVLNFILIPAYSYYGAAFATVLTELLVTVLMLGLIYKHLKIVPQFYVFLKSVFAAGVMGFSIFFFKELNLLFVLFAAAVIYFAVLYLFGGLKKEDIVNLIYSH